MIQLTVPKQYSKRRGFSLIEVIVFVSVLSVALISLIASVSYSSLLLINAQHKVVATRYNEEVAEWLKYQREYYGYAALEGHIVGGNPTTYCFNSSLELVWPELVNIGACPDFALENFYKRELRLSVEASEITAQIVTSWQTLGQEKEVQIVSKYNDYGL
jgi:type II secretory pathway pseudopilin PulG